MTRGSSKPFDTTLNSLVNLGLTDWATYLASKVGVPITGAVGDEDSDLSDQVFPDKVFTIAGPKPYLIHLEFESTSHLGLPRRLHNYNSRLMHKFEKPVYSVLVLLRPRAQASDQTGTLELQGILGETIHRFRYTVIRVWQENVDTLLSAGPAFIPLSLLTDEASGNLESAFDRFRDRLSQPDIPRTLMKEMIGHTFTMCGLRYSKSHREGLFMGIRNILEDSETYQEIRNDGKMEGLREGLREGEAKARTEALARYRGSILRHGTLRFGPPDAATETAIQAIDNLDHLDRLRDAVIVVSNWAELLATP